MVTGFRRFGRRKLHNGVGAGGGTEEEALDAEGAGDSQRAQASE